MASTGNVKSSQVATVAIDEQNALVTAGEVRRVSGR